ncbi:MAG: MFS transporter [archaeon]|nr:MFS transporter [archaeon]
MGQELFTKNFFLDTGACFCCTVNYFVLLITIVGFSETEFGASAGEAGLAAGIYVIGGLLSRLTLGKYIELVGRKRMLVIGLLLAFAISFAYFFVNSLAMLYAVRFIHGMAYGISSTGMSDIIAKIIPATRRGEGLGYYYLGITAASAIGPMLGLILAEGTNFNRVFTVGVVMYAVAAILALMMNVPEEVLTEEQKREAKRFNFSNLIQVDALPLAITVMIFYFSYSGVLSFIASYTEGTNLEEVATYYYLAVSCGTFISRLTTGKIYDRKGPNIIIIPGYIAFAVSMTVFATTTVPALFMVAGFFMGYGISIIFSICQAIVVSRAPPHRYGVTSSTFSAMNDLGTGLGPSILGVLAATVGFRDMYLWCVAISLFSLCLYWTIHGRKAWKESRAKHSASQ